jgi:hypothetical protein
MLLDDGERLSSKCLQRRVVALLRIFLEQLLGPLMRADLLLGLGLVEIVLIRRAQIVDQALMLLVERGRQLNVLSLWTIPLSSAVICECASTMCWLNCLTGSDLPLVAAILPASTSLHVAHCRLLQEFRRARRSAGGKGERQQHPQNGNGKRLMVRTPNWWLAAARSDLLQGRARETASKFPS